MQPDQQQRIMGYFIEEAKDHLNTIEQGLLNLQSTIEDPEMINEVFRAAHSVKGGAAMLGLNGIQRVSHRLEDFFKVLKETPIRVDQKLENLFLKAFDALQELLGQLQGPFGLTEDATHQILANVDPTFEELEHHLNELAGIPALVASTEVAAVSGFAATDSFAALDSALEQLFRNEVPLRLREMLQLFKQSEADTLVRQQLQEVCRSLSSLGEQYQLDTWCHLIETARRAIAHPDNQYRILAPLVIRDIKLAQELVLANRLPEITPCPQLQELAPVAVISPEPAVQDDFADLLSDDLLTEDLTTSESFAEADSSLDLTFEDLDTDAINLDLSGNLSDELAELDPRHGPEVGMAELNSLADLFEGEMPELGLTWQQEEILADSSELLSTETGVGDGDDSVDFSDLLFDESPLETPQTSGNEEDDLSALFGDDLDESEPLAEAGFTPDLLESSETDDFADLLEISDSTAAVDLPDLATELDADSEQNLLDLNDSDALGLDLLDFSSDSNSDSLLESGSELELEGALDDLSELFDGLSEGDLHTPEPQSVSLTSEAEPYLEEITHSQDFDDSANWNLAEPEIAELSSTINGLEDLESEDNLLSDFDFESFVAIDSIETTAENPSLSLDEILDTDSSSTETDSTAPFDSANQEDSFLEDLSPEDLMGDLDLLNLDEPDDNLLGELDLTESSPDNLFDSSDSGELGIDDLTNELEPATDNLLGVLDLTEPSPENLLDDLDLRTSGIDDLLDDLAPTEPGINDLVEDVDVFPSGTNDLLEDLDLGDLNSEAEVSDLNLSELDDLVLAESPESFEANSFTEAPSPVVPDPWGDEGLNSTDSTAPLSDMGFVSLNLDEQSNLDDLSLDAAGLDIDLSSEPTSSLFDETFDETDIQQVGDGDLELSLGEFDISVGELDAPFASASDLDFASSSLEVDNLGDEESNLDDVFGTMIQDGFPAIEDDQPIILEEQDLAGFSAEVDAEVDVTAPEELLTGLDDSFTSFADLSVSEDNQLDHVLTDDLLVSDILVDGLDDSNTTNSFGDFDDLLEESAVTGLGSEETSDFDDQDEFDHFADESSPVEAFDDLDAFLEPETPASSAQADEFGDLENLLGEGSTDGFADLDELLDDSTSETASLVADPFGDLDSQVTTSDMQPDLEDFSDLESLLSGDEIGKSDMPISSIAGDAEFDDLNDLLKDAEERMGPSVKASSGLAQSRRTTRPGRVFSEQTMRVPVKHLDNLSNLVGELVVNRNSLEQDQERLRQSLDNLLYQVQQLSDVGQRMQDLYERSLLESSLLASRQGHRHHPLSSIRSQSDTTVIELDPNSNGIEYDPLEMDRFTGFHSLSQEMIELIVRVRESSSDIEFIVDETEQVTRMFRQVTTQLQEGLTRSRMVPFAQTADRLPRAVRDISMKVGKQAELVIEGRETLIDKMILEQLYDPMTHLVNNAITHGIESPAVRAAAGKPPAGRIVIRAFHQGNQTIISVSDDGAGIDVERVKAKAVEKGLISPAEAHSISRLDAYDILFHPGFSTKDQADDFSGRGVGMDVVRTSLSEIRGVINTDSNPGKGTSFTIRLPLTLSISKALCCISDRARIAFPMDGVEDMLDVPKERIQTNAEGQPCIAWRDTILPLRPLADLLAYNRHLSRGNVYGGNQEDDMVSIVVLRSAGNFLALQVDQVMGEQEIVIKQLEGPVPKPIGVAGATVLGDGRIMPIADVLELIDLSMGRIRRDAGGSLWEQDGVAAVPEAPAAKAEPMVLIVDDSITVRELLSMTFNKVGYRVEQARDGQEAWEKLRSGLPCDIVFCDIEMPRMDGLELLSRIQKDANLKHLPIAMLTSRGADRHRQMAASLGASGYFTKPYLEEALLDAAQRMLKGERLLTS